jgi:hypothetical protein
LGNNDFSVRVGQDEIGRILNLKDSLNRTEEVRRHAVHYQRLGWNLEGRDGKTGDPLDLDFSLPSEEWSRVLDELSLAEVQVNLAVLTGSPSRLLVLEVNQGEGALALEALGDWRADCIAAMGDSREQHYYVLPPDCPSPLSFFQAPQVLIYAEGGVTLVPPSLEPQARDPWRWLSPPWERPPRFPQPAVWQFIHEHVLPGKPDHEVPTWAEIYRVVSPYGVMLKALLFPVDSQETYYLGILNTALDLGLKEPTFLLGLVWHAPHGEARHRPDKWEYLQELVAHTLERHRQGPQATDLLPATLPGREGSSPGPAAIGPDVSSPVQKPALDPLELVVRNGSGKEVAGAPPGFDQSVSGQFFQLLAGLGERVIMESCRYEALLSGLGSKAGEMEHLITDWERGIASPFKALTQNPQQSQKCPADPIEFEWASAMNQQGLTRQQLLEVQAAASEFLENNPDLVVAQDRMQMVIFCLKNYVSINPECATLPFREKLAQAGKMARGFLRIREQPES